MFCSFACKIYEYEYMNIGLIDGVASVYWSKKLVNVNRQRAYRHCIAYYSQCDFLYCYTCWKLPVSENSPPVGRVVFVGGKPGNFPLTGSDLPSHWFAWKLRGEWKGGGKGEREGWGRPPACLTPPPHWLLPQIPPCPKGHLRLAQWAASQSIYAHCVHR